MRSSLVLASFGLLSVASHATVLTFDGLGLNNYGLIPQEYGDRFDAGYAGPGAPQIGLGYTPNIDVSYRTADLDGNEIGSSVSYWNSSYGDLVDVIFPTSSGFYGEVTLMADAGWDVVLNEFNVASYPQTQRTMQLLEIVDGDGNVLFQATDVVIPAGATNLLYTPNLRQTGSLTIRWGSDWNIGMDNISFNQIETVPEPGTLAALALGLAALKRRKK